MGPLTLKDFREAADKYKLPYVSFDDRFLRFRRAKGPRGYVEGQILKESGAENGINRRVVPDDGLYEYNTITTGKLGLQRVIKTNGFATITIYGWEEKLMMETGILPSGDIFYDNVRVKPQKIDE